jgi:DNA-binding PadR family transcriptional regulator
MERIRLTSTTVDVLDVLYQHGDDVYGLKVAKETGLATGTIYPILARLERAGWVGSHWDDEDPQVRGSRKRYYRLTQRGREQAKEVLDAKAAKDAARSTHRTNPATGQI